MIDTVRWKIPVSRDLFRLIRSKSVEYKKKDIQTGGIKYIFYRVEKTLGSFDRNVNFFIPDGFSKYISVELSLPKYLHGNNVILLGFDEIKLAIQLLYNDFVSLFGQFTTPDVWEVVRADFCYAWKFDTIDDCFKVLQFLKRFSGGRKEKIDYKTSIFCKGSWFSTKFYNKGAEFKLHDYKNIRFSQGKDIADFIFEYSKSVLRFEITMRKAGLLYHSHKFKMYNKDLTKQYIYIILQLYFKKYLRGMNTKFLNVEQVFLKLTEKFTLRKSKNLLTFYLLFCSSDKFLFDSFCTGKASNTISGYFRDLSNAHIGMPLQSIRTRYDMSIPSTMEVIHADFLPKTFGKKSASTLVTPVESSKF